MVLMAIDHVRVYAGVPAGGPTFGVFFTRWVTHFCVPAFVFLAGTGAFLHGRRLGDTRALARYLVTRGAILVALELTYLRLAWTFNVDFGEYNIAGVIWMLGWCMILMAGLVRCSTKAIGIFGIVVMAAQQLMFAFGHIPDAREGPLGWLLRFLYFGGEVHVGGEGGPPIAILYVIIPWIGVMAAGYAFGSVMLREPAERRRFCLRVGLSATAAFLIIASIVAAKTASESDLPFVLAVLAQQKYPASQLFLMMTLGPTIALLPSLERARGWFADVLATFGRAPLFYYLLHIPAIHAAALVVSLVREGSVNPWLFGNHPLRPPPLPDGYMWSLPLLYLVFALVVAILYVPCKWFARMKAERRAPWLAYL